MRTIHADLTTSQQAATATPYLYIRMRSRDRTVTRTYQTTDSPNRILGVEQAEGRYGGMLGVAGAKYPISSIIQLQDADGALSALDYKGYRVEIGWGFNTASGNRVSGPSTVSPGSVLDAGPGAEFVVTQRRFSEEGKIYVELHTVSLWGLARMQWLEATALAPIIYKEASPATSDTKHILHIMQELLGGDAAICVSFDGAAYTAESTYDANGDANGGDALDTDINDVALMDATPAVNDALYVGLATPFDHVTVDISTVGVGTWTITWEYWNGAAWVALVNPGPDTNTLNWKTGRLKFVYWDRPTDWATRDMSAVSAQFPAFAKYYVRARVSAFTAITTQPLGARIFAAQDFAVSLDTSTAGQGDDFYPTYESDYRDNISKVVETLLSFTRMALTLRSDGFHLAYVDNAGSPVYTYDGSHAFYKGVLEQQPVLPNRVIYLRTFEAAGATLPASGTDNNAASQASIGIVTAMRESNNLLDSAADLLTLAGNELYRLTFDAAQGDVEVKLTTNQEVWDLIRVEDARAGQNYNGRVSELVRWYGPGVYRTRLILGGLNRAISPRVWHISPRETRVLRQLPTPPGFERAGETLEMPWEWVTQYRDADDVAWEAPTAYQSYTALEQYPELGLNGPHRIANAQITSGQIISKDFRTAANVGDAGGPAGIRFNADYIAGYSTGTTWQFRIRSSDGKAEFGAGAVVLDSSGITITDAGGTGYIKWEGGSYRDIIAYNNQAGQFIWVSIGAGTAVTTFTLGSNFTELRFTVATALVSTTDAGTLSLGVGTGGVVKPTTTAGADITSVNLGTTSSYFSNIYAEQLNVQEVRRRSGAGGDIGSNGSPFSNLFLDSYEQFVEISDPAAPDANKARLYSKDNGAGKTQLAVRFATGAVQVLATEP